MRAAIGMLALLACGGPLDRQDGVLHLVLQRAPNYDRLQLQLLAGQKTFDQVLPRPSDDVVRALTAVPAGPVQLSFRLWRGDALVDAREGLTATVSANRTSTLAVDLGAFPEVVIEDPPEGHSHAVYDGPLFLNVRSPQSPRSVTLVVEANGIVTKTEAGQGSWTFPIEPSRAGRILPAPLVLRVSACWTDAPTHCAVAERTVQIHRRCWRTSLDVLAATPPARWGEAVVWGAENGDLYGLDATTGQVRFQNSTVGPLDSAFAAVADRLFFVSGDYRLGSLDLQGAVHLGSVLSALKPSSPAGGATVWVGAGRSLLRGIDLEIVAELPAQIRAEPLVTADSVVVADLAGNVQVRALDGSIRFSNQVGGPVRARPVFYQEAFWVVRLDGTLLRLGPDGPLEVQRLGGQVIHSPLVVGRHLVIAAGDQLYWYGARERPLLLGAPITGAPALWSQDEVVLGLRTGQVLVVNSGGPRPLSQLQGAALHPLVLQPSRVVVAGTGGAVECLRAEENF